jgi:predicted  nucleic acid-binding Zn-ribbon protein
MELEMNAEEMQKLIDEQRAMLDLREAQWVKIVNRVVALETEMRELRQSVFNVQHVTNGILSREKSKAEMDPAVFTSNRVPADDLILDEQPKGANDGSCDTHL